MNVPEYLQPPPKNLWQFDEDYQAVEWSDVGPQYASKTIAITAELAPLLRKMLVGFGGLPDFTAILLIIAASRKSADCDFLTSIACSINPMGVSSATTYTDIAEQSNVDDQHSRELMLKFFGDLKELGRQGCVDLAKTLQWLYPTVIPISEVAGREEAIEAIEWLEMPIAERPPRETLDDLLATSTITIDSQNEWRQGLLACWSVLSRCAERRIDVDQAVLKLATGVDEIPQAATVEEIEDDRFSGLIAKLETDAELCEIAKSARQVASVLSLPLAPSDPSQLPIGGVSDITNRGNPERLLATELAADPMLLLARIATGQALYLRRESPPDSGIRTRQILIENSVRTWGQTRLRALAVALGLASNEQSRRETEVAVGTLCGDDFVVEDFSSKVGLIVHLQRLSAASHPGLGLLNWVDDSADEGDDQELPVLVLSSASWRDEDFQATVRELDREMLVATIDHQGDVCLLRRDRMGEHVLRNIRLDALNLGEKQRPTETLPTDLPAFVRRRESPLRFGLNSMPTWCAASTTGLWVRSPDSRLLWFDQNGKGGRAVLDRLVFRKVHNQFCRGKRLELVVELRDGCYYVLIDANHGVEAIHRIESSTDGEFFFDLGSLYKREGRSLQLIDKGNGKILDSRIPSGLPVAGTPFHYDAIRGVEVFCQAGNRLVPHHYRDLKVTPPALGFRDGNDVPIFITPGLTRIRSVDPMQPDRRIDCRIDGDCHMSNVVALSSDRREAIVGGVMVEKSVDTRRNVRVKFVVNLSSGRASRFYCDDTLLVYTVAMRESTAKYFGQIDTLTRIVGAGVDSEGLFLTPRSRRIPQRLRLTDPKGFHLERYSSDSAQNATRFGDTTYIHAAGERLVANPGKTRVGWGLRKLRFGDATLWLDSRGMLHFATRANRQQLTLVLRVDSMAGWISGGDRFGDAYYHSDSRSSLVVSADVRDWFRDWLAEARLGQS